jgi:oligoendopeptidase F
MYQKPLVIFAALILSTPLCAQSLGDVARQQQQKKNQQPATGEKKVLTNEDMPKGSPDEDVVTKSNSLQASNASHRDNLQKESAKPSAEELHSKIQKRKEEIAETQERIDKIEGTINFVQNNRNIYTNAPEYNEHQKQKQQAVEQLKGILKERQDELKQLQEQARQAGYGSAVYD